MFTARNAKLFSFQRATGQRKLAAHHRIRLSRNRRKKGGISELHIGSIASIAFGKLIIRHISSIELNDVELYPCMVNLDKFQGILAMPHLVSNKNQKKSPSRPGPDHRTAMGRHGPQMAPAWCATLGDKIRGQRRMS